MAGYPIQVGEKFGKLTTVRLTQKVSKSGRKRTHWVCKCDCGHEHVVDSGNLRNGNTKHCLECRNRRIGNVSRTHGMSSQPGKYNKLHNTWKNIKRRCYSKRDKRYADYGGRGIKVCERWQEFANFAKDMGEPPTPEHSIERIDNDGDYCPENCKWIPMLKQSANRRSCIMIDHNGKRQNLAAHCRDMGLPYDTIKRRIHCGWEPVEALTKPIKGR